MRSLGKFGTGLLALVMAVWHPLRALLWPDEMTPVCVQSQEREHIHPELPRPELPAVSKGGILGNGSADVPFVGPYSWEEAANVAIRARYDNLRRRAHLAESCFSLPLTPPLSATTPLTSQTPD